MGGVPAVKEPWWDSFRVRYAGFSAGPAGHSGGDRDDS